MRWSFQSTLPTRGSDPLYAAAKCCKCYFNPRSPRGGATQAVIKLAKMLTISIHAPHEGERPVRYCTDSAARDFNPRSPRGGATPTASPNFSQKSFQSTLPTRGSDIVLIAQGIKAIRISIHAPHEGERRRKSAFVCSISANLLNIIHCGTVTRAVSRRRIALFRLFSVRRSDVFMYAYASH